MKLKERIAVWYIARRLRKTLGISRKEWRVKMKPFPKWMAIVFGLISAGPIVYAAFKSGQYELALTTLLGVFGLANTHSATGTGGKL